MQIKAEVAAKYPDLKDLVEFYSRRQEAVVFWEDKIQRDLRIVDAGPNKLIWEFDIQQYHCNQLGNLHGGCAATIIDVCSSFAVLTWEGKIKWKLIGVSTDLTVSFLRGLSAGQTARLECDVQRVGKNLASIYTKIYDETGAICYSGTHSKYCIDSRLSNL